MGSRAELSIGTAIQDGWQVFRRSPWPFVFFALFALVLSTAVDLIPDLPRIPRLIGSSLVDLWASVGLIRGAWPWLDRRPIRYGDLIRINLAAIWSLFSRQVALAVPRSLFSSGVLFLSATAADSRALLQSIYLQLLIADPSSSKASTALIPQMQGLGPISTIRKDFRTVRSDWWQVLGLLVLQALILLLGVIACGFGLLADIPVVACSTASAYRQLFGPGTGKRLNNAILTAILKSRHSETIQCC